MKLANILQLTEAKFDTELVDRTPWDRILIHFYLTEGWVGDVQVTVSVKFNKVVPLNLTGACIEFAIRTREEVAADADVHYKVGEVPAAPTAQIIGAVINTLRGELPEHWDFMYAEAKDNVSTRVRVYTALFKRFAPPLGMVVDSLQGPVDGGIVMARQQDMTNIMQLADKLFS